MGRYTQREYEEMKNKRLNSAYKRHEEQKRKCDTLTEAQHNTLSELCGIRHNLHVMSFEKCWLLESQEHEILYNVIGSENENSINLKLSSVGLSAIEWEIYLDELDEKEVCEELGYSQEEKNEAFEKWVSLKNIINGKIENYLQEIDKQHGTNYKPTGAHRALSL